jgi:chemotaxis regulatin CheY-phosphate phosphatase CheZ
MTIEEMTKVELDKEIQEISEDFKDASKRLDTLVKENSENLEEALNKELETVSNAEQIVAKALADAEKSLSKEAKSYFSRIKDLGSWWNGSNSGL